MPQVVTHNGKFHADEATAIAILSIAIESFSLRRTRDDALHEAADMRIDVGRKYNPDTGDFDHHQREPTLTYPDGLPMASAGLVWHTHGRAAAKHILLAQSPPIEVEDARLDDICQRVTDSLIRPIDLYDTGNAPEPRPDDVSISQVVAWLNPVNIPGVPPVAQDLEDSVFMQIVDFIGVLLMNRIMAAYAWSESHRVIEQLIEQQDTPLLILDQNIRWKDHALDLDTEKRLKLVTFPTAPDGNWMVQTVPISPDSFDSVIDLPEAWAGLDGQEFADATGVPDAVFCHNGRFVMAAKSREGAVNLANQALQIAGAI
jgi:uncharacterized UPF0160 family protein